MTSWLKRLLYDKYEVTIWFTEGDKKTKSFFELSELNRLTKHLCAVEIWMVVKLISRLPKNLIIK